MTHWIQLGIFGVLTGEGVLHDDVEQGSPEQLLARERGAHGRQLARRHRAHQGRGTERREGLSGEEEFDQLWKMMNLRGIREIYT